MLHRLRWLATVLLPAPVMRRSLALLCALALPAGLRAQTVPINGNLVTVGHTNYCSDTGSTDAYACSLDYTLTTYVTGARYTFRANTVNTGAATLNLNSIGARAITRVAGGVTTPLLDGDICAGQDVEVVYDGTQMQMVSQRCTAAFTGQLLDTGGQVYNVKAAPWNAKGDGVTDDRPAIIAAKDAASVTGGVLYFPPGTYLLGATLQNNAQNVIWRGAGMYASVLKAGGAWGLFNTPAVPTLGPSFPTFEDLGFDGNWTGLGVYNDDTSRTGTLTFRRCRFSRFAGSGVFVYSSPVVFDGNLFEGRGDTVFNTGILLNGPLTHPVIINNRFRYVYNGVIGNTDDGVIEDGVLSGNFFDLGWYTLPVRISGDAGTTYTATTLTDATKTFAGFGVDDILRVLPVRRTATGTIAWTKIVDTGTDFTTVGGGVLPGEIVRSGGKFAIVAKVNPTSLEVEEWLDDTTRELVSSPPTGTYTVYKTILGKYASHTATAITVDRWYDLQGNTLVGGNIPATGTLYEVLPQKSNYPFHCEPGCVRWKITNNTTVRGYSDQLSYFGTHAIISHNMIGWGQDMGITIHGHANVITNNKVWHQGMGGIGTVALKNSTVSNNSVTDTTWTNTNAPDGAAGIILDGEYGNVVSGNVVNIETAMPLANYGIAVLGAPNDSNLLIGNQTRGHVVAGIRLDITGGPPTNVYRGMNVSTNEPAAVSYGAGTAFAIRADEARTITVECVADATALTTGDGKCFWPVPTLYVGWAMVGVQAHVGAVVASGAAVNVDIDVCGAVPTGIRCSGTNRDLLATNLTIDINEDGSETATPAVITAANAVLALGEWVRWNIDAAGTGTQGLYVTIILQKR